MAYRKMSVTQEQIANRLGVSTKSVMRVMNGHQSVSDATRRKVLDAARELGYDGQSNYASRALVARRYGKHVKTGIIAVVMPSGLSPMRGAPFYSPLLDGIEQYADATGLDIYLWYQRPDRPVPRLIREHGVDGVICLTASLSLMTSFAEIKLPVVSVISSTDIVHVVGVDNREGSRLAVCHLAALGHRRIAYLGFPESPVAAERLLGYRQGLMDCDLPVCEELIDTSLPNFQTLSFSVKSIVDRHRDFTALVCYNDTVAMEVVTAFGQAGVRVPEDISVVGFDDISVASRFEPALTSISYDQVAIGARAAEMVDEFSSQLVRDGHLSAKTPCRHEIFPVTLVVRSSTRRVSGTT